MGRDGHIELDAWASEPRAELVETPATAQTTVGPRLEYATSRTDSSRLVSTTQPASRTQARDLQGSSFRRGDSHKFSFGALLFGGLLFVAGAVPSSLPALYILFFAVCMPLRVWHFVRNNWGFFLVDFCYFANVAVCAFLLLTPSNPKLQMLTYALADGPLAWALAAWQCALVFGSSSHYISVMIHLFPGLAMFSFRWAGGPKTPEAVAACVHTSYSMLRAGTPMRHALACWDEPPQAPPVPAEASTVMWTFVAPLAFYAVWQFAYWLVVQVCFRRFILANKWDTSYTTLARRAMKADNALNRFVRRGSTGRRITMYGLLQLGFTLGALGAFQLLYRNFYASFLWQVAKIVLPVWYGSVVQCQKVPQRAVHAALSLQDADSMLRTKFAAAYDKRA